jgi:GTP-binding protein
MPAGMTISFVVPARNEERYIEQTLRAILAQPSELIKEITLVDNGSTDRTVALATALDPRIKVLSQPRPGIAPTKAAGIAAAQGDIVACIDADTSIARWIRKDSYKDKSDIIVVVNKVDRKDFDADEFYKLGFSDVVPVSAEHSTGIEDLWDLLKAKLEAKVLSEPENTEKPGTEILVLGRPNVGKSTLMNRVIGENRHVVSDVAGTTRDPIASDIRYHDFTWRLFDTAGLRRPGRRERGVEWVAGNKVKDLAAQADVAMLIVDANEGVTDMDAAIGGMAVDFGMSVLVIYNKWDLITGEEKFDKLLTLERTKDMKLEFLEWCPQLKISAKTGRGTEEILPVVERLVKARQYRVQTSKLNEFFNEYVKEHEHPAVEGNKRVSFYYITQTNISPPTFVLFTNVEPNKIHFSFRRYLVNSLRKAFPFEGSPIKLHFKKH